MSAREPLLLVTGGNGFVMGNVVRHWLDSDRSARAIVVDSFAPDAAAKRFFAGLDDRLAFVTGDIREPGLFANVASADRVTHVVHGAAVTSINRLTPRDDGGQGLAGALPALETNLLGTARVLAWADRLPELKRFIYVSTGSVYGPEGPDQAGRPLPEEGYIAPDGLYGVTKYASELLTRQSARQFGLPAVSVRFSSVFGPMDRETPARAVALAPLVILSKALAGEIIRVSDLGGVGDFIYALDLAGALCRLLRAEAAPRHEVYNVALGEAVTVGQLVELAAELVPGLACEVVSAEQADVRLSSTQAAGRWGAYDIGRLQDEFGWRPRPLRQALADYCEWLRGEAAENGEGGS